MDLVQNPFLLCLLLAILCAGEKPTDRPNGKDLRQAHHNYRRVQLHHPRYWLDGHLAKKVAKTIDVQTKCFCIIEDQTSPKVPQLLQFQGSYIKKLVVYLYQDDYTGTIKIHIPNREKQRMLPDLTYDQHDLIAQVTNELISDLVKSENSIYVPNANPQPYNQELPSEMHTPIKKHYGSIKTISNLSGDYQKLYHKNNHDPGYTDTVYHTSSGYEEPASDHVIREINLDMVKPELDQKLQSNKISVDNKLNSDYGYQEPALAYNETPEKYDSDSSPLPLLDSDGTLTFDDWFIKQIKNVERQRALKYNSVDLKTLKELIQKTLLENGITLTNYGALIDSHNARLDMSNLKLRTVLIGRPMNFDSFINGLGANYKLSTDVPYLEAIFLNLVHPWKILGVIPLGLIFLPNGGNQASPYEELYFGSRPTDKAKINPLENNPEHTWLLSKDKVLSNDAIDLNSLKSDGEKLKNTYELFVSGKHGYDEDQWNNHWLDHYQDILTNQQQGQFDFNRKADETDKTNADLNNTVSDSVEKTDEKPTLKSSGPISELNKLINEKFISHDHDMLKTHNLMSLWNGVLENSKDINHIHSHLKDHNEKDELPHFRIIGGDPAISSGYPLRIKGRTGSMETISDSVEESS